MTLEYTKVGQVKTTMLDYIDEISNTLYKAYPSGGGTKSSDSPGIIFKAQEDCGKPNSKKLWSFITWWRKYFMLPSGTGWTPAPQSHSSPRE